MDKLTPIPTPPAQRLREFRVKYLPIIVFAGSIIAILLMWRDNVGAPSILGQVDAVQSEVVTPDSGYVTNLFVTKYQTVKAGDKIAEIVSTDTRRLDSALQFITGEFTLTKLQYNSDLDMERLKTELRVEYFRYRVENEAAKAQIGPAERDYKLATVLLEQKIVSEQDFDFFAKIYQPLKVKVEETGKALAEYEEKLKKLNIFEAGVFNSTNRVDKSIQQYETERRRLQELQTKPIVLRAPIDGMVNSIHHLPGENIVAGESIATISSVEGERIIGYLREPLPFMPKPNMAVRVKSRSFNRETAWAKVLGVGPQFEVITNVALLRPGIPREIGLPVAVSIPATLKSALRPGQPVELFIQQQ